MSPLCEGVFLMHSGPIELWDERKHLIEVLNATEQSRPVDLDECRPPTSAGAYLLTCTHTRLQCYKRAVEMAWPVYAGSTINLRDRISAHRLKIRHLRNVDLGSVQVSWVVTSSPAGAVYAERLIIGAFRPAWNESWLSGFGSNRFGVNRTGTRRSAFDALHPSRRAVAARVSNSELKRRVEDHLEESASCRRLWAPLCVDGEHTSPRALHLVR